MRFRLCRPEAIEEAERLIAQEGGDITNVEVIKAVLELTANSGMKVEFFRTTEGNEAEIDRETMEFCMEHGFTVLPADRVSTSHIGSSSESSHPE